MVLLAITPVWLLPADTTKLRSDPFIGWIDRLTDRIPFQWGQGGSRDVFSISSFGFYPDGTTLGGTVSPSSQPVLSVVAERPSLLRGTIHDTYTGDRWLRNTEPEEHRLDPARQVPPESQRIAFDLFLPIETLWPSALVEGVLYDTLPYQIRMLTNTGSSLFTPGRVLRVLPETGFDVLYDDSGELFAQRSLRVRDSYTVVSRVMRVDDPAFQMLTEEILNTPVDRQILSSASAPETAGTDPEYLAACLQLPDTLPASVRNTAFEIVNGARNPYEAVLRIESFFQIGFAYSLVVPDVPQDSDFVAWFLESRVGYCTYYATATAILARAAGIPARYVEGFAMPAGGQEQEDGRFEYLVTGRQAHAWCEVYLNGVGWIAVDATPGYDYALPTPTPTPTVTVTPQPEPTTRPADPTPTLPPPVTGEMMTPPFVRSRRLIRPARRRGSSALVRRRDLVQETRLWYKVSFVRMRGRRRYRH
jgi:transglutaminase-like putative cysteine protease